MLRYLVLGLGAVSLTSAATLYNGAQKIVLAPNMTTSCDSAFNTTLNCPDNVLQFLTYSNTDVAWNTSTLTSMCTTACKSSLASLKTAVTSGCGTLAFNFNSANMTFVDIVDLVQYKFGQVCLADASSGSFCSDVETTWNITTMVNTNKATWPTNTNKTYIDLRTGGWLPVTDVDGTIINTFNNDVFVSVSSYSNSTSPKAADYWGTAGALYDDSNYGWTLPLEYDEYPLEIQCSSCWMQRFKYGFMSKWGSIWDDITTQIWTNMQLNCKINQTITPVNDYRNKNHSVIDFSSPYPAPTCYQNLTINTNYQTCAGISVQYQVPTSSLRAMNPGVNCFSISNSTICAPPSCPIAVVPSQMTFSLFWKTQNYTNMTQTQFLGWNKLLDTANMYAGDTVCVGPASGFYTPTLVAPAYPTIYTTTASHPDPTPSGTIANCGKYYKVQSGDYCNLVAMNNSLTFSQLIAMNPSIDSQCTNLLLGYDYCVAPVNGTTVPPATTTLQPSSKSTTSSTTTKPTSTSTTTTTTTSSYPAPPGPTVSGTTSQCKTWYTTVSGDTCAKIDSAYGITLTQFRAWNTYIDAQCSNLWVGYSYCVNGPTVTTTTTTPTTTTAGATPTPTQTGMVSNCKKFYQAVSGDTCDKIASANSISTSQFINWNPAVGSSCASLWAGYYYCVSA